MRLHFRNFIEIDIFYPYWDATHPIPGSPGRFGGALPGRVINQNNLIQRNHYSDNPHYRKPTKSAMEAPNRGGGIHHICGYRGISFHQDTERKFKRIFLENT